MSFQRQAHKIVVKKSTESNSQKSKPPVGYPGFVKMSIEQKKSAKGKVVKNESPMDGDALIQSGVSGNKCYGSGKVVAVYIYRNPSRYMVEKYGWEEAFRISLNKQLSKNKNG